MSDLPRPPADEFAELVVVGIALINPRQVPGILSVIRPEYCYWPAHARLLEAAIRMAGEWAARTEDERIDHWLDDHQRAEAAAEITGRPTDAEVAMSAIDSLPVLSGFRPFAERIVDAYHGRLLMRELALAYNALAEGTPLRDVRPMLAALAS